MKVKIQVKDRATAKESRAARKIAELERRLADGNEKLETAQRSNESLRRSLHETREDLRLSGSAWTQRLDAMAWALQLAKEATRSAQQDLWKIKEGDKLAVAS